MRPHPRALLAASEQLERQARVDRHAADRLDAFGERQDAAYHRQRAADLDAVAFFIDQLRLSE